MKHLKSSLSDLQHIFEHSLVARDLAEPLASFDDTQTAATASTFMEREDFDVVGIRHDGLIAGYAERSDLSYGMLGEHLCGFDDKASVCSELATISEVLSRLADAQQVFVCSGSKDRVWGIITRGDLQKAPVRMFIFGLISLLEMQFLRLIRDVHPDAAWQRMLSHERIEKAEKILEDRRRRNEGTDLADCLQFGDKATILSKTEQLRVCLGFESCTSAKSEFENIEKLRNDLVHSQDILAGHWPGIVELVKSIENLIERCESL